MKQSVERILRKRIDEQGENTEILYAMRIASKLNKNIQMYIINKNNINIENIRKIIVELTGTMKQAQTMLWELQLILGIDALEKLTEDSIEWQELQSIPH